MIHARGLMTNVLSTNAMLIPIFLDDDTKSDPPSPLIKGVWEIVKSASLWRNGIKFFRLTKLIPAALILVTAKMAFSNPVPGSSRYLVSKSSDSQPNCFIQKTDGTTLNLSSICGKVIYKNPLINYSKEEPETLTIPLTNEQGEVTNPDTVRDLICKSAFEQAKFRECLQAISNVDVSINDTSPFCVLMT